MAVFPLLLMRTLPIQMMAVKKEVVMEMERGARVGSTLKKVPLISVLTGPHLLHHRVGEIQTVEEAIQ